MKNWGKFSALLFLATLTACAPAGLAGRTDLPLVQATPSGDVKVTYDRDKISYWSPKYGISLSVPSHLRVWAREFKTEKNPLGEEYPFRERILRARQSRKTEHPYVRRVLTIKHPYDPDQYTIWLRLDKRELSDAEIKQWITRAIGRFSAAQRFGMPERSGESEVVIDGVKAIKADYVWSGGQTSLTVTFRTGRGTCFFYARPRDSYYDLEALLKTIKFVRK